MKATLGASDAHLGLPVDLRPGQSIAFEEGSIPLAGLTIVPIEFGTGRIRLLVRHPAGRVNRTRHGAVHELTISEHR